MMSVVKWIRLTSFKIILLVLTLSLLCGSTIFVFHWNKESNLKEKIYCDVALEDDFADDHVILILNNETSLQFNQYDTDDFPGIDCIQVTDLTKYTGNRAKQQMLSQNVPNPSDQDRLVDLETYNQILCLELKQPGKEKVLEAVKILEEREDVFYACPDQAFSECSTTANDTYYDEQWAIDQIQLPHAWDIETGSSTVLVGVLDSGIDGTHPDLVAHLNTDLHRDFTSGSEVVVTTPTDPRGHGTHVAGIIGAQTNNSAGISGVCWNVTLVSLRVLEANGKGDYAPLASAIDFATENDIPILNMSLGGINKTNVLVEQAVENYPGLMICAAGNDILDTDSNAHYPSNYDVPNIISVGASNSDDMKWFARHVDEDGTWVEGSNYGEKTVDLFAPGASILSCFPLSQCVDGTHNIVSTVHYSNGYHIASGTSMAAPYVTGVAALLLSKYPDLTSEEVKDIIMRSVDVVTDLEGLCVTGGRLNAYKALTSSWIAQYHTHDGYTSYTTTTHAYTCTICGESATEEEHNYKTYSSNPGPTMNTKHRACCPCGYYRVESHLVRVPADGPLTFPATCILCGLLATDGDYVLVNIEPELEQMGVQSTPGSYTLSDGTTIQILTENGSYVLPSGIIVLSEADAALMDAGLLDPYALVESATVPSNPGHVTE